MARAVAHRGLLVQFTQFARGGVDGEGTDRPAGLALPLVSLIDRIQKTPVRMDCQEARVGGLGCQAEGFGGSGAIVIAKGVNTLALRAGVGTDVEQVFGGGERQGGQGGGSHERMGQGSHPVIEPQRRRQSSPSVLE